MFVNLEYMYITLLQKIKEDLHRQIMGREIKMVNRSCSAAKNRDESLGKVLLCQDWAPV